MLAVRIELEPPSNMPCCLIGGKDKLLMWISLDVLVAALVIMCEFKVFILLWILYTKDTISLHHVTRSFYI